MLRALQPSSLPFSARPSAGEDNDRSKRGRKKITLGEGTHFYSCPRPHYFDSLLEIHAHSGRGKRLGGSACRTRQRLFYFFFLLLEKNTDDAITCDKLGRWMLPLSSGLNEISWRFTRKVADGILRQRVRSSSKVAPHFFVLIAFSPVISASSSVSSSYVQNI